MPTVVVPFRGPGGKTRLEPLGADAQAALARAMLADVLDAAAAIGHAFVVTSEAVDVGPRTLATRVEDPGGGQGAAVAAGLAAAVAVGATPPFLVVNADLPCATARDLRALAAAVPPGGLALAAAADGTTNALGLSSADLFEPLYGPGSAERFAAVGSSRGVDAPNLGCDVDTVTDLITAAANLGPHTRGALAALRVEAAA